MVTFITPFPWSTQNFRLSACKAAISISAAAHAHACSSLPCRNLWEGQPYPPHHAAAPPPDFYWTTRAASFPSGDPTVIVLNGVWVVALRQRVGDGI